MSDICDEKKAAEPEIDVLVSVLLRDVENQNETGQWLVDYLRLRCN